MAVESIYFPDKYVKEQLKELGKKEPSKQYIEIQSKHRQGKPSANPQYVYKEFKNPYYVKPTSKPTSTKPKSTTSNTLKPTSRMSSMSLARQYSIGPHLGGDPNWFGHADYEAAKALGFTPEQVYQWMGKNTNLLQGNNRPGYGGLYEDVLRDFTSGIGSGTYNVGGTGSSGTSGTLPSFDESAYQKEIDDLNSEMQALLDSRKFERRQANKMLRAQQAQAANAARAGQMAEFRIGTQTPSGQTGGTGQFKRRLQIKPVTSSALSIAGVRDPNKLLGTNTMLNV